MSSTMPTGEYVSHAAFTILLAALVAFVILGAVNERGAYGHTPWWPPCLGAALVVVYLWAPVIL